MLRPTASRSPKYARAIDSLITTTFCASSISVDVNSRPSSTSIPSVVK
jgi:hypothetical protein